ncbi:MAG: PEGA domain-containing protein [Verrucomicrobiota bacterium]
MKSLLLSLLLPALSLADQGGSVFVISRVADGDIDSVQASAFRDALAAELSGYGFSPNVRGDQFAEETGDEKVSDASTLNQARQANSEYALVSTLRNLNEEVREFSGYGTQTSNRIYTLSFSYRLLKASDGSVLTGGNGQVRKGLRATEGAVTAVANTTNELIGLAAQRIGEEVAAAVSPSSLSSSSEAGAEVLFTIIPRGMGMTVPEVTTLESGELFVTGERNDITLDAVTVLVDGVTVGSAPGSLSATPGLHEITLQREGFDDWQRTVNVREDMDLTVRMSATDAEIQRFREQSAFLEGLRSERVLTDAEAERILGIAQMFAQSGLRWDIRQDAKSDIKVDTDEAITIEQNNRTLLGDNPKQ